MRVAALEAMEDFGLHDFIVQKWRAGLNTSEVAAEIRDQIKVADDESTVPTVSEAQAYAYGVIARHQDALYASRQQEAQRA